MRFNRMQYDVTTSNKTFFLLRFYVNVIYNHNHTDNDVRFGTSFNWHWKHFDFQYEARSF